ncbi:head decoration protein [Polycladidibacter hongkongensis]|uniref:head decoration protein n=1 Tax=Polycladidibacter hongkongensis TaxID=1647556 RepID=UPI00082CD1DC|nr:head decoration protein [Pseudovibrio hongkongensis]
MTKTMRARDLSFLLSEASGNRSRETVTLSGSDGLIAAGTVLGKMTASGKYKPATAAGNDGAEKGAAVLCYAVDPGGQDAEVVVIARDAEVKEPLLVFHTSVNTGAEITAKRDELAEAGIITR